MWAVPDYSLAAARGGRFSTGMSSAPQLSRLSRSELEALLVDLFVEVSALKQVVGEQREEIARLKGLKGRPTIRPSGMDQATGSAKSGKWRKSRGRGKVTPRVIIDDQVLKVVVPTGSRFKGHERFLVQDLVAARQSR